MMTRPSFLKETVPVSRECVPMTRSISPKASPALTSSVSFGGGEAREGTDTDGKTGVAFGEGLRVLGDQQGRGHEDSGLIAVLDGLEGGAHGDLGLAVADVAGEQAVHGDGLSMSALTSSMVTSWSGVST